MLVPRGSTSTHLYTCCSIHCTHETYQPTQQAISHPRIMSSREELPTGTVCAIVLNYGKEAWNTTNRKEVKHTIKIAHARFHLHGGP